MSESSTETESVSGGEEEMAMMSITDVIPVSKNLGEVVRNEKEPVAFAKDKPVADLVKESGLKNGSLGTAAVVSASMGGKEIAARAKGFPSQNLGEEVAAAKIGSIARCGSEPNERSMKKEREGHEASTQMLTLQEQMIILRQEQCRLLKEREKGVKEGGTSASGVSKLADARDRLARAKHNREQLGLHYTRKEALAAEEGATLKMYKQLKDEYFGLVRQAGELDLQLKEMEEDLTSSHHSLGRMERELWAAEDKNGSRKKVANPWQVGVPYGSGRSGR